MSKKFSSFKSDQRLWETFRSWKGDHNNLTEAQYYTPDGKDDPFDPTRHGDSWHDDKGASDEGWDKPRPDTAGEVSVSTKHIKPVLSILFRFMKDSLPEAPVSAKPEVVAAFLKDNNAVYEEVLAATHVPMVSSRQDPMASAMWDGNVFDDVYNLENFKQDPGRVIRSILKHIMKKH